MNKEVIEKILSEYERVVPKRYISLISKNDLAVIALLTGIINRIDGSILGKVFERYKMVSDEDFVKTLTLRAAGVAVGLQKSKTRLFNFQDIHSTVIQLNLLYSYSKVYHDDMFCLILNEGPVDMKKQPVIYNKIVYYNDEELRDLDFDLLIKKKNEG